MIYFTSDCHFWHTNILTYEPETRPFDTIEEMNENIISNWNNVVKPEDTVYVLGDMFMGKISEIESIYNRLNGKVIVIRGNHETKNRLEEYARLGIEVKDIEYIQYKGAFFILCHFPILNEEFHKLVSENNGEVKILYGHIHSSAPKGWYNGTYHVGVDTNNLTPISIQQIWSEYQAS